MEERDDKKLLNINVGAAPTSTSTSSNINPVVRAIILCLMAFSLIGVFSYVAYRSNDSNRNTQQYDKKRDDSIQKSYDGQLKSKDDSLRRLDIKIQQYELVIDSLRERYRENIVKIESIKTKHNEKAKHIGTLSDDGLIRFFTDRYGQKK